MLGEDFHAVPWAKPTIRKITSEDSLLMPVLSLGVCESAATPPHGFPREFDTEPELRFDTQGTRAGPWNPLVESMTG